MRFLIVDDDPKKVEALSCQLAALGIQRDDIVSAQDAAAARRQLAQYTFDAMLIDVLLPARIGGQPSGATSVELLRQIIDDGTSRAPQYIVGITASAEALQEFESEFQQLTLHVIHVTPDVSEWKEFLQNFVTFMRRAKESQDAYDFDVCVLTALRHPELDAVLETWDAVFDVEKLLNRGVLYRSGILKVGTGRKRIVCAHPNQMGPVAAVHAAEAMLSQFRPRLLLMTGICGGFSGEVRVGDVVVADKSWDWQAGKWTADGTLLSSMDQKEASGELVAIARTIESELDTIYGEYRGERPEYAPKMVVGPMPTGSSVVASRDIQEVFRQQHRKMVAVDMECYGLYYAAANSSGPEPKVLCIKGVSDLADRRKVDKFQRYCSYVSARTAYRVVMQYFK